LTGIEATRTDPYPLLDRSIVSIIPHGYLAKIDGSTCNVPRTLVGHVSMWAINPYSSTSKIHYTITTRSNISKLIPYIPNISTLILSKFFLYVPLLGKAYTSFCLIKPKSLY
jgi:hypothetical protein